MREILFRGKSKLDGKWVSGSLINCANGIDRFISNGKLLTECVSECARVCFTHTQVIPETIGQDTGLADKKNKRIFEGDIVEFRDYVDMYKGTVRIGKYTTPPGKNIYGYYIQWQPPEDKYVRPDLYYWTDEDEDGIEVIGNIYDNPELLGVSGND